MKKVRKIILGAVIIAALVFCLISVGKHYKKNTPKSEDISITDQDLQEYRKNIGDSMDIKKSVLLIFNTKEECQDFINEHGNTDIPLSLGLGVAPQMEDGYYNVVGNSIFENIFDNLRDGEYFKKPIGFGGAFCYLKRIENYSITDSDEDLKKFIKQEKTIEKGGDINEKNN